MPNWKKVILSGSDAALNNITASGDISASNFIGLATSASHALNALQISNNTNNYVLTSTGTNTINGESNLTFTGTKLNLAGDFEVSPQGYSTGFFEISGQAQQIKIGDYNELGNSTLFKLDDSTSAKSITFNFGAGPDIIHTFNDKGLDVEGNITASGDISASGDIYTDNVRTDTIIFPNTNGKITTSDGQVNDDYFTINGTDRYFETRFDNDSLFKVDFGNSLITLNESTQIGANSSDTHTFIGTVSIPGFSDVSASLAAAVAGGDNLGNHTATQNLNMGGYAITNVGNVDGVDVSALDSTVSTHTSDISNLTNASASFSTRVTTNESDINSIATFTASLDPDIATLSLPASTTISDFAKTILDDGDAATVRSTIGVDAAGTDNSTNVTLAGSYDYITISGQQITRNQITNDDLAGSIANAKLTNSAITIAGQSTSLGGSITAATILGAGSTSDLPEGTNEYYTDAKVKTKLNNDAVVSGSAANVKDFLAITEADITDLVHYTTSDFNTDFGNKSTTDLSEGTNLYYTDAKVKDKLNTENVVSGSATDVKTFLAITEADISDLDHYTTSDFNTDFAAKTTSDLSEGTNLYYTDARVKDKLNTENVVSGSKSDVLTFLNVEDGADVTDAANVTTALGSISVTAHSDVSDAGSGIIISATERTQLSTAAAFTASLDPDIATLSLPASTTISTFGASLVDDADASAARTTLGVDAAGTINYTHPTFDGDDIDIDTGALTGATVISDLDFNITTDTNGHVTDANAAVSTRALTLSDLGYTGDTNANYIEAGTNLTLDGSTLNLDDNISLTSITASYVSASNAVITNEITASGGLSAVDNTIVFSDSGVSTAELYVDGHITASGNIKALSDIQAENYVISNDFKTRTSYVFTFTPLVSNTTYGNIIKIQSPNTVTSGVPMGSLYFTGENGGGSNIASQQSAVIRAVGTETQDTGDNNGGQLEFWVTPTGTENNEKIFTINAESGSIVHTNLRTPTVILTPTSSESNPLDNIIVFPQSGSMSPTDALAITRTIGKDLKFGETEKGTILISSSFGGSTGGFGDPNINVYVPFFKTPIKNSQVAFDWTISAINSDDEVFATIKLTNKGLLGTGHTEWYSGSLIFNNSVDFGTAIGSADFDNLDSGVAIDSSVFNNQFPDPDGGSEGNYYLFNNNIDIVNDPILHRPEYTHNTNWGSTEASYWGTNSAIYIFSLNNLLRRFRWGGPHNINGEDYLDFKWVYDASGTSGDFDGWRGVRFIIQINYEVSNYRI